MQDEIEKRHTTTTVVMTTTLGGAFVGAMLFLVVDSILHIYMPPYTYNFDMLVAICCGSFGGGIAWGYCRRW